MTMDGTEVKDGVTPTPETTETPTAKTYTEEELEKAKRDARSSALADIGRVTAEAKKAAAAAQKAQERLDKFRAEMDAAEIAAAQGNPEQLSALQERKKSRELESKLDQLQTDLEAKNSRLQEIETANATMTIQQTIDSLATKHNVNPERLKELVARFKEVTPEAIEDLAKDLPKRQVPEKLKTDSNVSTSTTTNKSAYKAMDDYTAGLISAEEARKRGVKFT